MPRTTKRQRPTQKDLALPPAKASRRELAPLQQLICDEIADMIVNGGNNHFTAMMITAAAHHKWWRWSNGIGEQGEESSKTIHKLGPRTAEEWQTKMADVWRANRKTAPERKTQPTTATERIRACVIDTPQGLLDRFLSDATPEEKYLMVDILIDHQSANCGSDTFDEMPLARAFEYALEGTAPEYVRVPSSMREQVARYVECLRAAKDCQPAA